MDAIVFERLFEDAVVPARATERSAGFDLCVYLKDRRVPVRTDRGERREYRVADRADATVELALGDTALLPLGFKATLPAGCEAQIRLRSSWAFKRGLLLPNAPGTIDADYPDEWMVLVRACNTHGVTVTHGDRIAQAIIARFEAPRWVEGPVGATTSRDGGFGSTG